MAASTMPVVQHIRIDAQGEAWIESANTRVVEVILDWLAYGWSPGEIHLQHPHLSLAQVHAAFSYYYDHQTEIDALISREHKEVERLRNVAEETPFEMRMRAEGRLP